jgi:hypothetical protein
LADYSWPCTGDYDRHPYPLTIAKGEAITAASWIGFSGSVLGGCLTMVGFFVAANNVKRQLRINLISREEERIEAQMPGLIQIRDELDPVAWASEPKDALGALERFREWMDVSGLGAQQAQLVRSSELCGKLMARSLYTSGG